MRILVFSDSHGNGRLLQQMIGVEMPVDAVFHLGDGTVEFRFLTRDLPDVPAYGHKGNCDGSDCGFPVSSLTELAGVKVLACHGHTRHVKESLIDLMFEAQEKNAGVCLYGHTHVADISCRYGIWFINPGAASYGRYAVIEIDDTGKIYPSLKSL